MPVLGLNGSGKTYATTNSLVEADLSVLTGQSKSGLLIIRNPEADPRIKKMAARARARSLFCLLDSDS